MTRYAVRVLLELSDELHPEGHERDLEYMVLKTINHALSEYCRCRGVDTHGVSLNKARAYVDRRYHSSKILLSEKERARKAAEVAVRCLIAIDLKNSIDQFGVCLELHDAINPFLEIDDTVEETWTFGRTVAPLSEETSKRWACPKKLERNFGHGPDISIV